MNKTNDDGFWRTFLAIVAVIAFALGFGFEKKAKEESAIKAGVGQYYLDNYYNRQFRWATNKEPR